MNKFHLLTSLALTINYASPAFADSEKKDLLPDQEFITLATSYTCGDSSAFDTNFLQGIVKYGKQEQKEGLLIAGPMIEEICEREGYSKGIGDNDNSNYISSDDSPEIIRHGLEAYFAARENGSAEKFRYSVSSGLSDARKGIAQINKELFEINIDGKYLVDTPQILRELSELVYNPKDGSSVTDTETIQTLALMKQGDRYLFSQNFSKEDASKETINSVGFAGLFSSKWKYKMWPVVEFIKNGGSVELAEEYFSCNENKESTIIDGERAYRLLSLGFTPDTLNKETCMPEITDTKKPNAAIVFGKDWNGAFDSIEATEYFKQVKEDHDLSIFFVDEISEIPLVLSSVNELEQAIIGLHGNRYSMSIDSDPRLFSTDSIEQKKLESGDTEILKSMFEALSENGTMTYLSCSTAEGGNNSLAGISTQYLRGEQQLIAARKVLAMKDVKFEDGQVSFIDHRGEDYTFRGKANQLAVSPEAVIQICDDKKCYSIEEWEAKQNQFSQEIKELLKKQIF